ncbi:sensor histidine kinase [Streptomyces nodosus]|uniref:histidine kinase n=1 Tax=Streptomyces nodosus TaxID=40318 RepID=A0A0B5DKF4_9ACTN|nr:histidine kinase [Streptomyces nodosus]QEV40185.1 HAMP domain-containing protein [Streptomyces nodosus]
MPATASEPVGRVPRRIRWTVRLRLTALYGALFLVSSAALLLITYLLVANSGTPRLFVSTRSGSSLLFQAVDSELLHQVMGRRALEQREAMLRQLLTQSAVALGLMSTVSVGLGWLMAGRALRPVRMMTDKARHISARNLHARLAVAGPDDELKDLGDTIDDLLGRLDTAFAAQKRFAANASHELRTPLTLQRAMIEVALADPAADAHSLRRVCERVLAAGEHQERLIEALLMLARSERGLDRHEPFDLARVVGAVLRDRGPQETGVEPALAPAPAAGDPRLMERLVANLVDNALRYNVPGGWVRVVTGTAHGRAFLRVVNSGPTIPPDRIGTLFQPFQRLASRTGSPDGHGLGLSIVSAVAAVHDADLTAEPGPRGGLSITVALPCAGG